MLLMLLFRTFQPTPAMPTTSAAEQTFFAGPLFCQYIWNTCRSGIAKTFNKPGSRGTWWHSRGTQLTWGDKIKQVLIVLTKHTVKTASFEALKGFVESLGSNMATFTSLTRMTHFLPKRMHARALLKFVFPSECDQERQQNEIARARNLTRDTIEWMPLICKYLHAQRASPYLTRSANGKL